MFGFAMTIGELHEAIILKKRENNDRVQPAIGPMINTGTKLLIP